jgi:hypothetical protein
MDIGEMPDCEPWDHRARVSWFANLVLLSFKGVPPSLRFGAPELCV